MGASRNGQAGFEDFDALCEELRGWDLDLRQLDRGPFRGSLVQGSSASAFLTYAHFNRVLEQRGSPPPGMWTFGIPLPDCRPFDWHGATVSAGDVVAFPPGWELDAVSYGDFEIVTYSIAEERFALLAEREHIDLGSLSSGGIVMPRPAGDPGSLERAVRQAAEAQGMESSTASGLMDLEIPLLLLGRLTQEARPRSGDTTRQRALALEAALAFVARHEHEPLTVQQLCEASGTSLRTLRRAFEDRFGVGPKAYLQARRLNGTHKLLRRATPERTKVADVANRYGFWHMGKFAADYRRQFGELPSQTLGQR